MIYGNNELYIRLNGYLVDSLYFLKGLGATEFLNVPLTQPYPDHVLRGLRYFPDGIAKLPAPVETSELSFCYPTKPIAIEPAIIVYSPIINNYISFSYRITGALWSTGRKSDKRTFLDMGTIRELSPKTMLLFISDNPSDLSLVSDRNSICQPDLMLIHNYPDNVLTDDDIIRATAQNRSFIPALGTYVISKDWEDSRFTYEIEENIHIYNNESDCLLGISNALLNMQSEL